MSYNLETIKDCLFHWLFPLVDDCFVRYLWMFGLNDTLPHRVLLADAELNMSTHCLYGHRKSSIMSNVSATLSYTNAETTQGAPKSTSHSIMVPVEFLITVTILATHALATYRRSRFIITKDISITIAEISRSTSAASATPDIMRKRLIRTPGW